MSITVTATEVYDVTASAELMPQRSCCGDDCCRVGDEFVAHFEATGDPRPPRSCLCCVPVCYLRPGRCERRRGALVYACLGATLARCILKKTCYRWLRPLAKTERGTPERRRALIALLPMTVGIEIGHLAGGLVHLAGVAAAFATGDQSSLALTSFVLQLVLIYCIHLVPLCVQRLNRVQAYNALEDRGASVRVQMRCCCGRA